MEIAPMTGGPPTGGMGLRLNGSGGLGAQKFFALIQSLFANRPEPLDPLSDASRRDTRPRVSSVSRDSDGGRRARESDASHATRAPRERARTERRDEKTTEATPAAPAADPVADEPPQTDPEQAQIRDAIREVVSKLRRLLARIEEGVAPQEGFAQLMKILASLQALSDQVPQAQLVQFFNDLGPGFEDLVEEVGQIVQKLETRNQGPVHGLLRAAHPKAAAVDAQTVGDLARSLVQVLGRALHPKEEGPMQESARPEAVDLGDKLIRPHSDRPAISSDDGRQSAGRSEAQAPAAKDAPVLFQRALAAQMPVEEHPDAAANGLARPVVAPAQVQRHALPAAEAAAIGEGGTDPIRPAASDGSRTEALAAKLSQAPLKLRSDQIAAIDRLVKMGQVSAQAGTGRLRIRLSPPQLGNLRMDLSVRDGILTGTLRVETPAARAAVLSQVEQLKTSLSEQGIEVGSFDVSVDGRQERPQDAREERSSGGSERPAWAAEGASDESRSEAQAPEQRTYVDHRA